MIESSNTQEPVESTGAEAASAAEQTTSQAPVENQETVQAASAEAPDKSLKEKILAKAQGDVPAVGGEKPIAEKGPDGKPIIPVAGQAPAFQPNFKYKAFGKEKEVDEFWRPLVKDAESEKKVKEVFTRADAFDDMKGRYENMSTEHQKTLQQWTALDRDVRRVTKFLNSGDYDNFFASLKISDDQLLQHLQRKVEIAKLSPLQQQQYQQGIAARAENMITQENMEEMQSNYTQQRVLARTMQLDMVMMRPEVQSAVSAWDSKMGLGAFRNLVIEEAQRVFHATNQDLPAENAVDLVLKKFGKLIEQAAPQAQAAHAPAASAPQAQTTVVQGKPVIPNISGRGTSPVKQAPKSLDDLRKMAKDLRKQETDLVANV